MNRNHLLISLLLTALFARALAPPLEREITLNLNNEPIKTALIKIQEQTGLFFSYRPTIIQNISPVSFQLKQKTVREALAIILPKSITYKTRNNYIILKERPLEKNQKTAELSGYVIDKNTERKLANVTIYDKNTLKSVTTNEFGYYSITIPNENQCINVNKENYQDTCVPLAEPGKLTNITINPLSDAIVAKDTVNLRSRIKDFSANTNDLFRRFKGYINTINVKNSIGRKTQFSFIPFLGTNGLLSGNVYNDYSFNVFGGYSMGNNILELGGFFNVNRKRMNGAQLAGFFNIVGDSVDGLQAAGFFNATGRNVKGVQLAGFVNSNFGNVQGFQGAGFLNFNLGSLTGFQATGFANINAKGVEGICMAGLLNANRLSVKGALISGMLNITADTLEGTSMAGMANINWFSKKTLELAGSLNYSQFADKNYQISGFINITAKGSSNLQVAGFLNMANHLKGLQLGLFNYADTASGLPIGLLSIVRKGLHQFEFSGDELFPANAGFRTGVNKFYNVFSIGLQPGSSSPLWNLGYGAGTSFKLYKKWRADISLTAHHVSKGKMYFATSELYKIYSGVEIKLTNKFSIAAGPTFNLYWSDALLPDYNNVYAKVAPAYASSLNLPNDFNLKYWMGGRFSLRFL